MIEIRTLISYRFFSLPLLFRNIFVFQWLILVQLPELIQPFADLNSNNPIGVPDLAKGYSFWLACGALVLNVVNMIVASSALCCAKGCC